MVNEYRKNLNVLLSENFNSNEFDCKGTNCCSGTLIDDALIAKLEQIRSHFGSAVTINSAYRCNEYNAAVGGASKSKHMSGIAADIAVEGVEPAEVARFAESIGILGIGLYSWGCHIDMRTEKSFWYSDKQEYRATFGGAALPDRISIAEWQKAAILDGFAFPKYGPDGVWGTECESVAKKAICKKQLFYRNKNLTVLIQKFLKITVDGKFGKNTKAAVTSYQNLTGLVADGAVGINTWKKMLGV